VSAHRNHLLITTCMCCLVLQYWCVDEGRVCVGWGCGGCVLLLPAAFCLSTPACAKTKWVMKELAILPKRSHTMATHN